MAAPSLLAKKELAEFIVKCELHDELDQASSQNTLTNTNPSEPTSS
jgi:hypothetical protein